jgi:hypothetical protein
MDFFCCAVGLECVATAAVNHHFIVFWMYIFFHNENAPKYLKLGILTILKHISTKIFWFFYLDPSSGRGCKREECFVLPDILPF